MRKLISIFLAAVLMMGGTVAALAVEGPVEIGVYAKTSYHIVGEYTAPVYNGSASVTTPNGAVSVTNAPAGAVTLVVHPMAGEALTWVDSCVDGDTVCAYEIHFLDAAGRRIHANGVRVRITASGAGLTVFSVTTAGAANTLTGDNSGGSVTFTADGSSYYVLAQKHCAHRFTDKASHVRATDATCTEAATYYVQCDYCTVYTTEKTVSVGKPLGHRYADGKCIRCGTSQGIPETGDSGSIFLWAGILILAAIALLWLFFRQRRKADDGKPNA